MQIVLEATLDITINAKSLMLYCNSKHRLVIEARCWPIVPISDDSVKFALIMQLKMKHTLWWKQTNKQTTKTK